MNKIKFYCITNKQINFINKEEYYFGWVGKEIPKKKYIKCDYGDNIFYKEKYYSELTFHRIVLSRKRRPPMASGQ